MAANAVGHRDVNVAIEIHGEAVTSSLGADTDVGGGGWPAQPSGRHQLCRLSPARSAGSSSSPGPPEGDVAPSRAEIAPPVGHRQRHLSVSSEAEPELLPAQGLPHAASAGSGSATQQQPHILCRRSLHPSPRFLFRRSRRLLWNRSATIVYAALRPTGASRQKSPADPGSAGLLSPCCGWEWPYGPSLRIVTSVLLSCFSYSLSVPARPGGPPDGLAPCLTLAPKICLN